ncbi:hypothetical protein INT45_000731 [Circinella minor]|uniref:Uncharacterized protein n=1 Tax=Circinella minor TaxID=1195481 RepID=A0A8H7RGM3_9FUNG|nr:hypothetical protein INT45_000731 [Circinella minor]
MNNNSITANTTSTLASTNEPTTPIILPSPIKGNAAYLLEIATNEVKGKNQGGAKFWDRIFNEFQKYGNSNERTVSKLKVALSPSVNAYRNSYKRTSLSRNKNFNVKPCFELLKTQKKWYRQPEHKKDAPSADGPETKEPIGVKKAKSNKKRSNEDVEKVEQLETELARKRVAMEEILKRIREEKRAEEEEEEEEEDEDEEEVATSS